MGERSAGCKTTDGPRDLWKPLWLGSWLWRCGRRLDCGWLYTKTCRLRSLGHDQLSLQWFRWWVVLQTPQPPAIFKYLCWNLLGSWWGRMSSRPKCCQRWWFACFQISCSDVRIQTSLCRNSLRRKLLLVDNASCWRSLRRLLSWPKPRKWLRH